MRLSQVFSETHKFYAERCLEPGLVDAFKKSEIFRDRKDDTHIWAYKDW